MNTKTYLNLRTYYYLGIGLLAIYAVPAIRSKLSFILDFEVIKGFPIISLVAILVFIGAYHAYTTRRFG